MAFLMWFINLWGSPDGIMHIRRITILSEQFPDRQVYPFNLDVLSATRELDVGSPITFFVGENGSGKSTLLKAIALKCRIHIWQGTNRARFSHNPHEEQLYRYLNIDWEDGTVPGSFFASEIFRNFAQILDEWAASDPGILEYFGDKSLMTQSHGQGHMAFFQSRFKLKGLYLLDEPENALSPRRQLELMGLLDRTSRTGTAQYIIATHSPILLAHPRARIYSFDSSPLRRVEYEQTDHYRIYKRFLTGSRDYEL